MTSARVRRWPSTTRRRRSTVVPAIGLPIAGITAIIGLWWLAVSILDIRPFLAPSPPAVAAAYATKPGYLLRHTLVTLTEAVAGFGIAVVAGLVIGASLAASRTLRRAVYPSLVALHAIPKLALGPLLVVWIGFGAGPKIVMVVLVCLFPIVLATATGLTTTPTELIELARSLSASRSRTFLRFRFPAAGPQIFVGLKTAIPLAVIGAIVGELFGATEGLGFAMQIAGSDTAVIFAALGLLAAMSLVLFYLLVGLEKLLVPWARHTRS